MILFDFEAAYSDMDEMCDTPVDMRSISQQETDEHTQARTLVQCLSQYGLADLHNQSQFI